MTRHRWIRVIWPIKVRELARRLQALPYHGEADSGYILDQTREGYLVGKFVERVNINTVSVDPLGQETKYELVEFKTTKFVISEAVYGLELIDPARSTGSFTASLSLACNDRLIIRDDTVNPLSWAQSIIHSVGDSCNITAIQLSKISLGTGVIAKAVISGKQDVIGVSSTFVGDRDRTIDKIKIEIRGNIKLNIVLGSNATASISGDDSAKITDIVRYSLANL